MTRTYAWAPQRSHTSAAVSGWVGARAPVNVAFLASCLRLLISGWLGNLRCTYSRAQHVPGRQPSPPDVAYADSESARLPVRMLAALLLAVGGVAIAFGVVALVPATEVPQMLPVAVIVIAGVRITEFASLRAAAKR
jgi:hypothetical protein